MMYPGRIANIDIDLCIYTYVKVGLTSKNGSGFGEGNLGLAQGSM